MSNVARCIGRLDYPTLETFLKTVTEKTNAARHVRMTTPAGQDVEFDNEPGRAISYEIGYAHRPGSFAARADRLGSGPGNSKRSDRL